MLLQQLVAIISELNALSKRTDKIRLLDQLLDNTKGSILKLYDKDIKVKTKINEKLIEKAFGETLSLVPETSKKTVFDLLNLIGTLATLTGVASVTKKLTLLKQFTRELTSDERQFIKNYFTIGLRSSVNTHSWLAYFVVRYDVTSESLKDLSSSYELYQIYDHLENKVSLRSKIVIKPMLASLMERSKLDSKLKGTWYSEPKYDGIRVVLVKTQTETYCYSRNGKVFPQEDFVRSIFPEALLKSNHTFILDGQVYSTTPTLDPFKKASKIVRALEIGSRVKSEQLGFVAFDVLSWNNKDLRLDSYELRRETLLNLKPLIAVVDSLDVSDNPTLALSHYEQCVTKGFEGVIFKKGDSVYLGGERTQNWLKLKAEEKTVDLVVIGAHEGRGKRAGLKSSFEVAAKGEKGLVSVGCVGSGLSDQALLTLNKLYKTATEPIILEIAYDYLQVSGTQEQTFGLRFPRVKQIRTDLREPSALKDL